MKHGNPSLILTCPSLLCTQQAFKLMKDQSPQGGRIINNGSISASVPRPNSAPYTASNMPLPDWLNPLPLMAANTILLQPDRYRQCGYHHGTIDENRDAPIDGSTRIEPTFDVKHVSDALIYMASLPLDTNVQFITVMATKCRLSGEDDVSQRRL